MASRVLVDVLVDGLRLARGVMADVQGYRLKISTLTRTHELSKDRWSQLIGAEMGLVFHLASGQSTPVVGACLRGADQTKVATLLDLEILDWDTLAGFWQMASHRFERRRLGQ